MRFEIPFPPRVLHPNEASKHWAKRVGPRKRFKQDCFFMAKTVRWTPPAEGAIDIVVLWHPKDHNVPDKDGCIANLKAAFDGIALAWGVNDKRFNPTVKIMPSIKGGKVIITVGEEA